MSVFVIFKTFSYVFEETIGFGVKALFARPAMSHLIKAGDIAKELSEKAVHFHGTFHGLKTTNGYYRSMHFSTEWVK